MTSFAAAVALRGRPWGVLATIEGVGDSDGLWRFCAQVPDYGGAAYKPWLTEWPDGVEERLQDEGGVADAGDIALTILDYGDALTAALRVDRTAATVLDENLDASETGVNVLDSSTLANGDVVYVGSEAMLVTNIVANTLTVTRGYLDTDATTHATGHPVLTASPYLARRRVRLYWYPLDGGSVSDEREIGTYHLDDEPELTEGLGAYRLTARSVQVYLSRLVCSRPQTYRIAWMRGDPRGLAEIQIEPASDLTSLPTGDFTGADVWYRAGKEIIRATRTGGYIDVLAVTERGALGTQPSDLTVGSVLRRVYVASRDGNGSFRYSPGPTPSTSRGSGTWVESDQWCDLALALLTSSADDADGLELANYAGSGTDAARSNWSALPVGVGCGIPVSLIDVEAWASMRQRTHDYRFDRFVIGDEPMSVARLLTEHFLRPIGADITIANGKIRPILRRLPLADESTVAIGHAQVLVDEMEPGTDTSPPTLRARIRARVDTSRSASALLYEGTDAEGREQTVAVVPGDAGLYASPAYYAVDVRPRRIALPSVRLDGGGAGWLQTVGLQLLQRANARPWRIELETDAALIDTVPGDLVAVTHADLPDLTTGLRGWTSVPGVVIQRRLRLDDREGPAIAWALLCYPGRLAGRIAPSALVSSVSSSTATCAANTYTETDAADGLPVTDAAGFAAGDEVLLMTSAGERVGAGTQTVVSVSGNDIELDGTFSGALVAGLVLCYADRDSAVAAQYTVFVYYADQATQTVGTSDTAVWRYAEP